MSIDRFQQVELLFEAVCTLAPAERDRYLDQACRDDAALRREVESLLAHDEQPHVLLAGAQPGSSVRNEALAEFEQQEAAASLPATIGRYRVIRVLGQGGMGIVYLAEQENPRRTVALKVIRPSLASGGALRRFEHEAQILGRLQHPGIAQIFEAGFAEVIAPDESSPGAQPFFAMEFIDGRPLHEFADHHKLGTRKRLELFLEVCDAVHHAHLQGVIHRDLKPHNILVNAQGQPKILDFGVARATDSDIQLTTVRTDIGQLIGTLPYMSPEQVAGGSHQPDLRSDVYALGVICYQLLTGQLPYDPAGRSVPEMVRIIADSEPPSLSSINRIFRGDLDTIVAKALEKDPARRYQSAAELEADVRRYLADEPIVARAPSAVYQLRKFARRNKAIVAGVVIAFVALCGGTVVATYQAIKASRSAALAERRLGDMLDAREREASAREMELRQAAQAARTIEFLESMIASADPEVSQSRDMSVHELLDRAAARVESDLSDTPEVAAAIHRTIGSAYRSLALYDLSAQHLNAAVALRRAEQPVDPAALAEAVTELGALEEFRENYPAAKALYEESLALIVGLHGEQSLAATSRRIDIARVMTTIGGFPESETMLVDAIAVLRARPDMESQDELASALQAMAHEYLHQDLAQAERLARESLEIRIRLRGPRHSNVAAAMMLLGRVYTQQDRFDEAESILRESGAILREVHGDVHPSIGYVDTRIGGLLRRKGDLDGAHTMFLEALSINRAVFGEGHSAVASSLNNVATISMARRDHASAEQMYREALLIFRKVDHQDHRDVARTNSNLGRALVAQRRFAEATPFFEEALRLFRTMHQDPHQEVAVTLIDLGRAMLRARRLADAEPLLQDAYAMNLQLGGSDDWPTVNAAGLLGQCLAELQRFDEAEPLLVRSAEKTEALHGPNDARTSESLRRLVNLYQAWNRPQFAAEYRDRADRSEMPLPAPEP